MQNSQFWCGFEIDGGKKQYSFQLGALSNMLKTKDYFYWTDLATGVTHHQRASLQCKCEAK
jgi:hypothetical protein